MMGFLSLGNSLLCFSSAFGELHQSQLSIVMLNSLFFLFSVPGNYLTFVLYRRGWTFSKLMSLGGTGYILYLLTFLYINVSHLDKSYANIMVFVSSALSGITASILYLAQGLYISSVSSP